MKEFEREYRYFVTKVRDANEALNLEERISLRNLLEKVDEYRRKNGKNEMNCVVIEDDWECYEQAWELVEQEWNA